MKRYLDTYVIRIYRRGTPISQKLLGVVEEIGVPGKKAFGSLDELWNILDSKEGKTRRSRKHENSMKDQMREDGENP